MTIKAIVIIPGAKIESITHDSFLHCYNWSGQFRSGLSRLGQICLSQVCQVITYPNLISLSPLYFKISTRNMHLIISLSPLSKSDDPWALVRGLSDYPSSQQSHVAPRIFLAPEMGVFGQTSCNVHVYVQSSTAFWHR